jgi:transcriptional regulator of heat shock response
VPPPSDQATFRRISLIPAEEGKAILVLSSSESEVRSLLLEPGLETSIYRLEALAGKINQEMQGKPVSFLNNYLSKRNEESISRDEITALEILNRSI